MYPGYRITDDLAYLDGTSGEAAANRGAGIRLHALLQNVHVLHLSS